MDAPKLRARQEILHYVLSFCISHRYGDGRISGGIEGFITTWSNPVRPGDLVILTSAPSSKWQIGWLIEVDVQEFGTRYLIESLEDGSLCWWENVGIEYFPRDKLQDSWRWTDRQWAFRDRWWRVCYKEKGAYIVRPLEPVFDDGFSVTLGIRTSHGFDDIRPERTYPDWRKVTKAVMATCYDECVAERERIREERKAAAEAEAAAHLRAESGE